MRSGLKAVDLPTPQQKETHMLLSSFCLLFAALPAAGALPGDTCSSTVAALHPGGQDIVDTAVAAGSFKTLAAALDAAV
jgi:hypothetical protein